MRVKVDWRSSSKANYNDFCHKHPYIELTFDEWKNIMFSFIEHFKQHIIETGEKIKLPYGFGEFSINKKKRKKIKVNPENGKEFINLPIDWKKTKEKGKVIYNFNYHTEGYYFGWYWFKQTVRFKYAKLWYFKPSRTTSRIISHYINIDDKYQHIYKEWEK